MNAQEVDSLILTKIENGINQNKPVSFTWGTAICLNAKCHLENREIINSIKYFLDTNKEIKIELRFYTDCQGNDEYNKRLSERRAEILAEWFWESGIEKNRIIPIGIGEANPLIECVNCKCPQSEHRKNRRLEIAKI